VTGHLRKELHTRAREKLDKYIVLHNIQISIGVFDCEIFSMHTTLQATETVLAVHSFFSILAGRMLGIRIRT